MPPYFTRANRFHPYGVSHQSRDVQPAHKIRTYSIRIATLQNLLRAQQQKSSCLEAKADQLEMVNNANERTRIAAQTRAEELSQSLGISMHERRLLHAMSIRLQVENEELLANKKTESQRQGYIMEAAHTARVEADFRAQEAARGCRNAVWQQEVLQQKLDDVQESRVKELADMEHEVKRQVKMRDAAESALAATEIRAAEAYQTTAILAQEKQALEMMVANLLAERDGAFQRELESQFRVMAALSRVEELEALGRSLEELYHLQHIQLQEYQQFFTQKGKENCSRNDADQDVPMGDHSAPGATAPPPLPRSPPLSPIPTSFVPPPVPVTLNDWFLLYENRWGAFQGNDHRCNLTFAHVPWPVSRFVGRLADLKEEEIRTFLTKKDELVGIQWREEVKRWHTDRFARVANRIHPSARNEVLKGFNRCIQVVTSIKPQ